MHLIFIYSNYDLDTYKIGCWLVSNLSKWSISNSITKPKQLFIHNFKILTLIGLSRKWQQTKQFLQHFIPIKFKFEKWKLHNTFLNFFFLFPRTKIEDKNYKEKLPQIGKEIERTNRQKPRLMQNWLILCTGTGTASMDSIPQMNLLETNPVETKPYNCLLVPSTKFPNSKKINNGMDLELFLFS